MREKTIRIGRLLRAVADLVDHLPVEDLDALLEGRLRLEVAGRHSERSRQRPTKQQIVDVAELLDQIREARTREQVMALLERSDVTKATLERIARGMDLPVLRSDTVDRLRQKIVESTVGFRINSDAIQGKSRE